MRDTLTMDLGVMTVTVSRDKLLATLRINRDTHQEAYLTAIAGYKQQALAKLNDLRERALSLIYDKNQKLQRQIAEFNCNDEDGLTDTLVLLTSMSFRLDVPKDHTESYDVAIKMIEWEVCRHVELTQVQFQCFVLDDWDWQQEFKHLSKVYAIHN